MLCALLAAACGGAAGRSVAVDVGRVVVRSAPDRLEAPVAEAVRGHLERSPLFTVSGSSDDPPVELAVREVADGAERGIRIAAVIADPKAPSGRWEATVEVLATGGRALEGADLDAAAARVVAVLEARRLLATGRREAVGRVLTSDDPEIVGLALDWIRDHQPKDYADAAVPYLASDHPNLVRRAAEILGRTQDPAYVSVLLDAAQRAPEGPRRAVYEALGRIGGDRAERFLELAAEHEASAELAEAARRALDGLRHPVGAGASARLDVGMRRGHR
ncbi:MAG: HEAT repeat domain-containing protein [Deltaproteobacteria bacterium]|nr:MAG: HEAT repeat domain-containing protein [Deltaproteobacteria bacterium]